MIQANMITKTQFIFIFQLLIIISLSFAIIINSNTLEVWDMYEQTYDQRLNNDPFCNASHEMKAAVCNAILSEPSIQEKYRIYLNKTAIFYTTSWSECEIHNVIVDPNNENKPQRMFACYGRHNPILSGWGIDDHYRFIYISGGPNKDSVFTYHRKRTIDGEKYILWEMISEIGLDTLHPITITPQDLSVEGQSIQFVSISDDSKVIEVNYVRSIIKNEYEHPLTASICDLQKEKKLRLCQIVVEQMETIISFPSQLLEHMFESSSAVQCSKMNIHFTIFEEATEEESKRDMFTCHGTSMQLSDGYYQNTVLVFQPHFYHTNYYSFRASIHNINIENI